MPGWLDVVLTLVRAVSAAAFVYFAALVAISPTGVQILERYGAIRKPVLRWILVLAILGLASDLYLSISGLYEAPPWFQQFEAKEQSWHTSAARPKIAQVPAPAALSVPAFGAQATLTAFKMGFTRLPTGTYILAASAGLYARIPLSMAGAATVSFFPNPRNAAALKSTILKLRRQATIPTAEEAERLGGWVPLAAGEQTIWVTGSVVSDQQREAIEQGRMYIIFIGSVITKSPFGVRAIPQYCAYGWGKASYLCPQA